MLMSHEFRLLQIANAIGAARAIELLKKHASEDQTADVVRRALAARKMEKDAETGTRSVAGTESLTAMTCPKCGDALQHTVVCPNCATGKLGYRHRYTCVCGGVDMISKGAM